MVSIVSLLFVLAFPLLGVMAVVWLILVSDLFTYLREHHPAEYEAMGRPALFSNNTPKNNVSFIRFIQSKRSSDLGDDLLLRKCLCLKVFLYTYMLIFFGLLSVMLGSEFEIS